MNYQSSGCSQMTKVLKAKQGLQLAFLLGVCFWLLYQIEHSLSKWKKDYGGSILNEQHGVVVLGRKGDAGWSNDDMNLVGEDKRKGDGGGGDDELDGNFEDDFGKELEQQYMVFLKNEEDKNIIESKQESAVQQPIGMANNATVVGRGEMLDGVHGFHDENGVPLDDHEARDDHENIIHQETSLNSRSHSRFSESAIIEEFASQEDMLELMEKPKNKISLEDSKSHATDDSEINSQTSSLNHVSEATQEDRLDTEDPHSIS